MDNSLSICIVSHNSYGAISGKAGHIGGVEWQTTLTAKWFAKKNHQVSMITWDEGGGFDETIDGVKIIKVCRQKEGLPGLRFIWPKWIKLNTALKMADADIYYHNLADCETGQVALWCLKNKRKFVFSVPSNPDCDPKLPKLKNIRERVLYRFGLKNADTIIVQNKTQQKQLLNGFGLKSLLVPMPCPDFAKNKHRMSPPSRRVLWVGRLAKEKRPDKLLDLASSCPDLVFDVVGPVSLDDSYSTKVYNQMKMLPNLFLHGGVSREQVYLFYEQAACLCCTSDFEGFPNTFLEAWSCGLPIVSTFDPDGLIKKLKLGYVSSDTDGLTEGIRRMLNCDREYQQNSQNARNYYIKNHSIDHVLPVFENIFHRLH